MQSTEFFINMKEKDIPFWNKKLSYYDQSKDAIEFYSNEYEKITKGVNIGGVFIHPWLYFHTNFYKTRITQPDLSEPIITPPLDDHAWYFAENYHEAELKGLGVCMFGTRGFSKTVLEASISHWTAITRYNGIMTINGGSAKDLNDVCQNIKMSNNNIEHFLRLPILTEDWAKEVQFGMRTTTTSELHSRLDIFNLEGGKDGASEKSAGGTPAGFIADEIGKFDPRKLLEASKPKFNSQYGAKLVHILAGTGGNTELSEGAKHILEHPNDYKLLRMNWDKFDNSIPEEAITWKKTRGSTFCMFVPGQMSYRIPVPKVEKTLSEFTKTEDKKLDRIKIKQTDWIKATEYLKNELASLEDIDAKNKQRMYHPMEVTDCFLTDSPNPFDVVKIQERRQKLKEDPQYRAVELHQTLSGDIEETLSEKPLADREYKGQNVDAPILLFGDEYVGEQIYANEFCGGLDDYKLSQAKQSKSLGAFYIVKRKNIDVNEPFEKIVCSYTARPHSSHSDLYENIRLASKKFKAKINIEAIDTGFASYLINLGINEMEYLAPALNPAKDITNKKKDKSVSKFGTYPTPANNRIMFDAVVEYTRRKEVVDFDEHGNDIVKCGIDYIDDDMLLKEMEDYSPEGGNYDRIFAFGWALLYCQYLDKKGVKVDKSREYGSDPYSMRIRKQREEEKKPKKRFNNFSRGGRFGIR